MRIVSQPTELGRDRPIVLAIGNFDGVHRGHQYVLSCLIDDARRHRAASGVLTFRPHPRVVLLPESPRSFITTANQQQRLLTECGIDVLIQQPFTKELAAMPAEGYVRSLVDSLCLRAVWVGDDFKFGHGRSGTVDVLRSLGDRLGFAVHALERQKYGAETMSSSRIRGAIEAGDVTMAEKLLGRLYELEGVVVAGDQRGRTIGVPTANLEPVADSCIPANGVYYCVAIVDGTAWPAATNVGVRPTVGGQRRTIEAHLLDFTGDLYGKRMALRFARRLRAEQTFDTLAGLVAQIHRDIAQTREQWLTDQALLKASLPTGSA